MQWMQTAYVLCEGRPENSITSWKNAPPAPQPLQILNYTLQIGKYRLRCEEISKQLILGQKFLGATNFQEPSVLYLLLSTYIPFSLGDGGHESLCLINTKK